MQLQANITTNKLALLAISGIVNAQHSCGGKNKERCLRPVFRTFTISDQYSFQKLLICQADISAFSGQNKVTILINRSGEINQEQNRLFV